MRPAPRKAKAKVIGQETSMVNLPPKGKTVFERVFYGDEISDSSSEESDFSEYEQRKRKRPRRTKAKKSKKRKVSLMRRSPTPEAPEISDIEEEDIHDEDNRLFEPPSKVDSKSTKPDAMPTILHLKVQGNKEINIDLTKLLKQNVKDQHVHVLNGLGIATPSIEDVEEQSEPDVDNDLDGPTLIDAGENRLRAIPKKRIVKLTNRRHAQSVRPNTKRAGFLDLEPNIRNRIYRLALVVEDPIRFSPAKGTARTAALLRTCHQVQSEGCSILYGENTFHFARVNSTRGSYYEKEWKEVGYKDVRRFLEDIGTKNRSYLRFISLDFSDAAPYQTPRLESAERRFVNDPIVFSVLKMIASSGAILNKFVVGFTGRQCIQVSDFHFLKALTGIRCHQLTNTGAFGLSKVQAGLLEKMKEVMEVPRPEGFDETKQRRTAKMLHEKPTSDTFSNFNW